MKRIVAVLAASGAVFHSSWAVADPVADFYTGKTVRMVIGGGMSGSYGLFSQFMARHVPKHLPGSPTVVVQSMTGGGGNKAMNYTYNAGPQDGSMVSLPQISVAQESLFNPKGFQYIGRFTNANIVTVAHKRTGVMNVADARKKSYTFGTVGRRNYTYVGAAILNEMAGTKFKIISGYRGTKPSYLAMDQGEVDFAASSWTTLTVHHRDDLKSGTYVPIMQMTAARQPDLPNVPAVTEFGRTSGEKAFVKIIAAGSEIGRSMAGPPKMPKYLVEAWRKAFAETLADPAFRADVAKRKSKLNPLTAAQLTKVVYDVMDLPKADVKAALSIYKKLLKAK